MNDGIEPSDGTVSCSRPPEGWSCSRDAEHDGPCAASPATAQSPAGQAGSAEQNDGTMASFLTEDERRFFAYMAEQRFRTVVEKDPEVRESKRARWQQVALWFTPDSDGTVPSDGTMTRRTKE